ncbi:MAG: AAA family ATPase [Firmicutes bacterium]|jgi:vesicle-fusing ATPase|nr:AAA family ATPase [Bacillota bacterium]
MDDVWKEIAAGAAIGAVIYLAYAGLNVLPVVFLAALVYVLAQAGGLRGFSRRFATVKRGSLPGPTFQDVGGQSSAKKELMEALDFVKASHVAEKLGIRPLKGILLTGPPGTGKTMLAKAAANYTDSAFVAASGSEFIEVYAGVGAQRVRELFRTARDTARSMGRRGAVVFIDEIEVLGGRRGQNVGHLEYDQTINQLLVEMDGLSVNDDVRILVIGATNRADLLDPALTRPGRFDRVVRVEIPDKEARLQILKLHTKNKPLAKDVDLERVARGTFGFTGAHLESLANEAAILAMREGRLEIEQRHLEDAIEKVILGEKIERRPSEEELRRIAAHEAGHAVVSEVLDAGSVASIAISPRGGALGYVRNAPRDDRYIYPKEQLENEIAGLVAGALAEEIACGSRSTGAAEDFERAVHLARRIVLSGMSPLGVVDGQSLPAEVLARAVSQTISDQEKRAGEILAKYERVVTGVAEYLVKHERMDGETFGKFMRAGPRPATSLPETVAARLRNRGRSRRRFGAGTAPGRE